MSDYSFDSVLENPLGLAPAQGQQTEGAAVLTIPLANIRTNPRQPRKEFDEASLKELAASINNKGI
jgi:ParB family chromosome partitioning protein